MARVDVRAVAASGVWRSPQPLPLAHLAVTVNASDSGDVLIFWTQAVNAAPPPAGVIADASLGIGQAATFDTGLTARGTVYVCDSLGGAVDALLAGSDQPIAASPAPPIIGPLQLAQRFLTAWDSGGGSTLAFSEPLPIPPGTVSVLIAIGAGGTAGNASMVFVSGRQSGVNYFFGTPVNNPAVGNTGLIVCEVSSVNDHELIVSNRHADGTIAGLFIPLQTPYVPQPLSVSVLAPPTSPINAIEPAPVPGNILCGSNITVLAPGQTVITIPAGRVWRGSVGIAALAGGLGQMQALTAGATVQPGAGTRLAFMVNQTAAAGFAGAVVTPDVYVSAGATPASIMAVSESPSTAMVWATGRLL